MLSADYTPEGWGRWSGLSLAGLALALMGAAWFVQGVLLHCGGKRTPEESAVANLRYLVTMQAIFRESDRDGDKVFDYGDLTDLGRADLISEVLCSGTYQGYDVTVVAGLDGEAKTEELWWAAADPAVKGEGQRRHFFVNQSGQVYASEAGPIRPRPGDLYNAPDRGVPVKP